MNTFPKVFFFSTPEVGKSENFQDLIVNIATGMQQLGIEYYASNNYWQLSPDSDRYLLEFNPDVSHHDCDVVVIERQWFEKYGCLPKDLFAPNRQYKTVYLDCEDGVGGIRSAAWRDEFRQFDLILRTHYTLHTKHPENVRPWAFGLSTRVLQQLAEPIPYSQRQSSLLVNFRHKKFSHSLRRYVEKKVVPQLEQHFTLDTSVDTPPATTDAYHYLRWVQTGKRHYPSYYNRLKNSAACACFGGFFLAPGLMDRYHKTAYYSAKLICELGIKTERIGQWDSWRLWESMVAGCLTLHVDFEKYGFVLPVMPENWKHYVGIDLNDVDSAIAKITEQPELIAQISAEGRAWAIEHYAPKPTALRFLETVSDFKPSQLLSEVTVR